MVEPSDRLRGWSNHTIINGGRQTGLGRGIATWPCGQQAEEGNPKPKWSPGGLHCLKTQLRFGQHRRRGGGVRFVSVWRRRVEVGGRVVPASFVQLWGEGEGEFLRGRHRCGEAPDHPEAPPGTVSPSCSLCAPGHIFTTTIMCSTTAIWGREADQCCFRRTVASEGGQTPQKEAKNQINPKAAQKKAHKTDFGHRLTT